ncbi:hypothetical protein L1049_019373 [Liquidambar formosana]|uniref:Uncharacterized protein n=1 Tax=Liquidambar formosana TaxID=63359 RepID=A0AAP0S5M2_LIQFO
MAMATLIEANPLNWKRSSPIQLPHTNGAAACFIKQSKFKAKFSGGYNKFSVKCFYTKQSKKLSISSSNECKECGEMSTNPLEVVTDAILKALKAIRKPAVAAVLLGLLLMYDPNSALAASGGRMGGKSFSSHSSSSSSRSYSARTPSSGFSYSVPYYAPSPFGFSGGGAYVGPAVGVGVGAGSSFFFIMMGFAAFILVVWVSLGSFRRRCAHCYRENKCYQASGWVVGHGAITSKGS